MPAKPRRPRASPVAPPAPQGVWPSAGQAHGGDAVERDRGGRDRGGRDRGGSELAPSPGFGQLDRALAELKHRATAPLLQAASARLKDCQTQEGTELALQALRIDDRCARAWQVLAVAREQSGDLTGALQCLDAALKLEPDNDDVAYTIGHVAYRLGKPDIGEKLFRHFVARQPDSADGANNLACALRSQMRFGEAIEVIRNAIHRAPHLPMLWNTLGSILTEQGDLEKALIFYDEAVRLDPTFARALYNRSTARRDLGDNHGALADCDAAIAHATVPYEIVVMRFAQALLQVSVGDLARGWTTYEARFDALHPKVIFYATRRPLWTPQTDVSGQRVLVFGEQGLGDEIAFANVLPDLLADIGPDGRLILALEPRLVALFQRSFPTAQVGPHETGRADHYDVRRATFVNEDAEVDMWAPMGSLLRRYRAQVDVAHWRAELAQAPGPKVGLLWKSLINDAERQRFYSPFDLWAEALTTPGVTFVNLQYGDCSAELQAARERFGIEIWTPPFDLKTDLDEVAALACALDLSIGPSNATTNIVGACGAPLWLIIPPGAWPRLGTDAYPWYPHAKVFTPPAITQWGDAMAQVAQALRSRFAPAA
jgi:tetratricopeptide (TPR) repeat protein